MRRQAFDEVCSDVKRILVYKVETRVSLWPKAGHDFVGKSREVFGGEVPQRFKFRLMYERLHTGRMRQPRQHVAKCEDSCFRMGNCPFHQKIRINILSHTDSIVQHFSSRFCFHRMVFSFGRLFLSFSSLTFR